MTGIVFTEFIEMVELKFGLETADAMIVKAATPTGSAYSAVGIYDHRELIAMVIQLSEMTHLAPPVLIEAFGEHLFARFRLLYPKFFQGPTNAFQFLRGIESYIHPEVRKLYPDAEVPRFESRDIDSNSLELIYRSSRKFADLAEGLIRGCFKHFQEATNVKRATFMDKNGQEAVRFTLTRSSQPLLRKVG